MLQRFVLGFLFFLFGLAFVYVCLSFDARFNTAAAAGGRLRLLGRRAGQSAPGGGATPGRQHGWLDFKGSLFLDVIIGESRFIDIFFSPMFILQVFIHK